MDDSGKELWFAEPVLGSLPPDIAAEKLSALGEPELAEALRTALIQIIAVALLIVLCWIIFSLILGLSIQLNPRVG